MLRALACPLTKLVAARAFLRRDGALMSPLVAAAVNLRMGSPKFAHLMRQLASATEPSHQKYLTLLFPHIFSNPLALGILTPCLSPREGGGGEWHETLCTADALKVGRSSIMQKARWCMSFEGNLGRVFAALCGDYNPIHMPCGVEKGTLPPVYA